MQVEALPGVDTNVDLTQLSSISGLDNLEQNIAATDNQINDTTASDSKLDLPDIKASDDNSLASEKPQTVLKSEDIGVKACDDPRFKKFFKMLQFGVPEPAVKLKMQNDGVDPSILDKPNDIVPGSSSNIPWKTSTLPI